MEDNLNYITFFETLPLNFNVCLDTLESTSEINLICICCYIYLRLIIPNLMLFLSFVVAYIVWYLPIAKSNIQRYWIWIDLSKFRHLYNGRKSNKLKREIIVFYLELHIWLSKDNLANLICVNFGNLAITDATKYSPFKKK